MHVSTFVAGIRGTTVAGANLVVVNSTGQLGSVDVSNLVWPAGSILQMQSGSIPPAGFAKIGTIETKIIDLSGKPEKATWDVYQKN